MFLNSEVLYVTHSMYLDNKYTNHQTIHLL